MSTQCEMPGLRAENPQGWMAAIGVQLLLYRMGKSVQLGWRQEMPILFGIELDETVDTLQAYLRQGSQLLDDLAALPKSAEKNKIALDFTAGRVNFTNVLECMTNSVTKAQIIHSISQVWTNNDDEVSLGWDPFAVKQAATLSGDKAPDTAKHRTEIGGQWLAAESLAVTCPPPSSLKKGYRWVTWGVPLDAESVYSVVQARSSAWLGTQYCANIGFSGNFKFFQPSDRLL